MDRPVAGGKVFVVDDDEAVRESLQVLLELQGYDVEAHDSAEAFLAAVRPEAEGCALIDLRMPGMDGIALIERLKERKARLAAVVVTGHGDVPLAVRAMKAGAADFIEKPYRKDRILEAVRQSLARGASGERARAEAILGSLTPREREVLQHLVLGHPNKIIAHELEISPRTVEIHRANLMRKAGAGSLSQLIRLAFAAGLGPDREPPRGSGLR